MASIGTLIGDPSRALMMSALMDGRARTATELADAAGITRQTASSHLGKLVDAGLLELCKQGRHRYFRVGREEVATALETLMVIQAPAAPEPLKLSEVELARTCYDHLAGRLSVRLFETLCDQGLLAVGPQGVQLSDRGREFFAGLGIAFDPHQRRPVARLCMDWSERRYHLAGSLGAALLKYFSDHEWMKPRAGSRAVRLTKKGHRGLEEVFGVRGHVLEN